MSSKTLLIIVLISLLGLFGCDLLTDRQNSSIKVQPGNDLVLNEIFSLAPKNFFAYSWFEIYNPTTKPISWFNESFPVTGHLVGSDGTLLRTANTGESWSTVSTGTTANFNSVFFSYRSIGCAVGDNGVIKLLRRVNDQFIISDPTGAVTTENLYAISGIDMRLTPSPTAFAVGGGGTILRTLDTGRTWAAKPSGTTRRLSAVGVPEFRSLFAFGDSGTVLKSTNSGSTWSPVQIGSAFSAVNFYGCFFDGRVGSVVGSEGVILRRIDPSLAGGNEVWVPETTNVVVNLRAIYFSRLWQKGWAVGDSGTIIKTTDDGNHWRVVPSPTTASLRAVGFDDSLHGVVAGEGGLIMTTNDGGLTWTRRASGSSSNFNSLSLLPRDVRVSERYVVLLRTLRKEFYFDLTSPFQPGVNPNFDFIVKRDTGYVLVDPEIIRQFTGSTPADIPSNGFVIINSDSIKFEDHQKIGPGQTDVINFSIGYYIDLTDFRGFKPVLWDLLESGEIILVKFAVQQAVVPPFGFLGFDTKVVDVVRWGGYKPHVSDFKGVELLFPRGDVSGLLFPNNEPAPSIPEWWSLARYNNDLLVDPNTASSVNSFFICDKPLPGWTSQRSR